MSKNSTQSAEAPETASLERIAATALDLAGEIRSATGCDDPTVSHYFQALGLHFENAGGSADIEGLSGILRNEIAIIRAYDEGDQEASERIISSMGLASVVYHDEPPWKVDSPEEAFILRDLLHHRIEIKGSSRIYTREVHIDKRPEAPRCAKILYIVKDKISDSRDLEADLDLAMKYIAQFNEIHQAYLDVAKKYKLELVQSEKDWLASLDAHELVDVVNPPVDLSDALEDFTPYSLVSFLFWEIQAAPNAEIESKIRRLLFETPDSFFVEERALISEVDLIETERADFERWLMEEAINGVFRTEVIAEIERRWPDSEVARRVGRITLERMNNQGYLARSKKQGKLHFTRNT